MEICNKDIVGSMYIELCYVSSDWRIYRNSKLQELLVKNLAALLDIEDYMGNFFWIKTNGGSKALIVSVVGIPEEKRTVENIKDVMMYANGLADGLGYM